MDRLIKENKAICEPSLTCPKDDQKHRLARGFCTHPVVYNYDNKRRTKKKDANCGYATRKRTNIALFSAPDLTPLLK